MGITQEQALENRVDIILALREKIKELRQEIAVRDAAINMLARWIGPDCNGCAYQVKGCTYKDGDSDELCIQGRIKAALDAAKETSDD